MPAHMLSLHVATARTFELTSTSLRALPELLRPFEERRVGSSQFFCHHSWALSELQGKRTKVFATITDTFRASLGHQMPRRRRRSQNANMLQTTVTVHKLNNHTLYCGALNMCICYECVKYSKCNYLSTKRAKVDVGPSLV